MRRLLALFIALGTAGCAHSASCETLRAVDPWIRLAPPGASTLVGYVRLQNAGDAMLELRAVSSPAFGAIEIHETQLENGMARMRRLQGLRLAAGESVALEPGGKHLMLFRPQRALSAGETVTLQFQCEPAGQKNISFTVRAS